jgi:protoheme ferro-lyase
MRRVLIAPIGFVCDHTEILFDIDVQARPSPASAASTWPAPNP